MKRFVTILLASLSLFTGIASALELANPFECVPDNYRNVGIVYGYIPWRSIDKDQDCHISVDEAQAWQNKYLLSNFDAIDTNKDGKISTVEEAVFRQTLWKAKFIKADTDKDGSLSRDEARAAGLTTILKNFDYYDANKDGKVTMAEIIDASFDRYEVYSKVYYVLHAPKPPMGDPFETR